MTTRVTIINDSTSHHDVLVSHAALADDGVPISEEVVFELRPGGTNSTHVWKDCVLTVRELD